MHPRHLWLIGLIVTTVAWAGHSAEAPVLNGIDVLVQQNFAPLKGKRLGLITNQTGQDRRGRSTIELLRQAPGVSLKVLFSPEHGIQGIKDEKVKDGVDAQSGLPIFSLYGKIRQPQPEQLKDLDALVFDLQDIGCRFYTYISTLGLCMEAAAKAGVKFYVLDRVNPIGGVAVEGPIHQGASSFTAFHALPVRHGMTVGELARMFNAERGWNCALEIIPVQGWQRKMWFDQTQLPWVNPSPNMRSLTEATLYPGVGLIEFTDISVGRGTATPFEIVGAPYIDGEKLAAELNAAKLPGVKFAPASFTPEASVFKDKPCSGVRLSLEDRDQCRSVDLGITLAGVLHRLYPEKFSLEKFDKLLTHPATVEAIRAGQTLAEIKKQWRPELEEFLARRAKYLLYR